MSYKNRMCIIQKYLICKLQTRVIPSEYEWTGSGKSNPTKKQQRAAKRYLQSTQPNRKARRKRLMSYWRWKGQMDGGSLTKGGGDR